MKVLVVEDNHLMAQMISATLSRKQFNVSVVADGASAMDHLLSYEFDVMLLDLRLRNESGLDLLRKARRQGLSLPVIVLSGDLDGDTKVTALEAGADDYLTKPFRFEELFARINAVVRRTYGHMRSQIEVGRLVINLDDRTATVEGKPVNLTCKEYDLLEALALQKGRMLTKETILNKLYGGRDEPGAKIIDVFVCKLRRKLSDALGAESPVRTIWGRGYVLDDGAGTQEGTRALPVLERFA